MGRRSGLSAQARFLVQADWSQFHNTVGRDDDNRFENVLSASNASRLAERWSYPTGGLIRSPAAVANGVVYIGSEDGKLDALDAKHGGLLWNYTMGDVVDSSPAVAGGVVYVTAGLGTVYALNASTGGHLALQHGRAHPVLLASRS